MRVLVWHWGSTGAGPRFLYSITKELAQRSDVQVFATYSATGQNVTAQRKLKTERNLEVRTYKNKLEFLTGIPRMVRASLAVRRMILKERIDIVFSPMFSLWQSVAIYIAVPRKVPYITIVHDAEPHEGDRDRIGQALAVLDRRKATAVVVLSKSVEQQLREQRFTKPVTRIFHPILASSAMQSIPQESKFEHSPHSRPVRVGFVGRLLPYKGLDVIGEIARDVERDRPAEFSFEVWGDGAEGFVQPLVETSKDVVDWHVGWIPDEDINELVQGLDILLLPYQEASQSGLIGIAVAEETPVVATPVGGLGEQVLETQCGVVSEGQSARALADTVIHLAENEKLYARCQAAADVAKKDLSWRSFVNRLVGVFYDS